MSEENTATYRLGKFTLVCQLQDDVKDGQERRHSVIVCDRGDFEAILAACNTAGLMRDNDVLRKLNRELDEELDSKAKRIKMPNLLKYAKDLRTLKTADEPPAVVAEVQFIFGERDLGVLRGMIRHMQRRSMQ